MYARNTISSTVSTKKVCFLIVKDNKEVMVINSNSSKLGGIDVLEPLTYETTYPLTKKEIITRTTKKYFKGKTTYNEIKEMNSFMLDNITFHIYCMNVVKFPSINQTFHLAKREELIKKHGSVKIKGRSYSATRALRKALIQIAGLELH